MSGSSQKRSASTRVANTKNAIQASASIPRHSGVMARDLSRRASLDEVCAAMSDLAELEISSALRWLGAEDLVVVGMGKLGGRELNVSSDIDLVFLYPGAMGEHERYETAGKGLIR